MPRRPPDAIEYVKYTVKRQFSVIQPERCGHDRTLQRNVRKIYVSLGTVLSDNNL